MAPTSRPKLSTTKARQYDLRIGATDKSVAYAPQLEDFIVPQSEGVEAAVQALMLRRLNLRDDG